MTWQLPKPNLRENDPSCTVWALSMGGLEGGRLVLFPIRVKSNQIFVASHSFSKCPSCVNARVSSSWVMRLQRCGRGFLIYPEAGKFMPERWLGEDGRRLQSYFVLFNSGTQACIGRNQTYLEQSIMLATVVHRYEFALPHREWGNKTE